MSGFPTPIGIDSKKMLTKIQMHLSILVSHYKAKISNIHVTKSLNGREQGTMEGQHGAGTEDAWSHCIHTDRWVLYSALTLSFSPGP